MKEYEGINSIRSIKSQKVINEILWNNYVTKIHWSQFDLLTTTQSRKQKIHDWWFSWMNMSCIKITKSFKWKNPSWQVVLREFKKFCEFNWYSEREILIYKKEVFGTDTQETIVVSWLEWWVNALKNDNVFITYRSDTKWNYRTERNRKKEIVSSKWELLWYLSAQIRIATVSGTKIIRLAVGSEETTAKKYIVNIMSWWIQTKVTLEVSLSVRKLFEDPNYINRLKKFEINLLSKW